MLSNSNDGLCSRPSSPIAQQAPRFSNSTLIPYLYFNMTPVNFCYFELANLFGRQSLCAYTGLALSQVCYAENLTASTSAANANGINYTISGLNVSALCSAMPDYAQGLCTDSFITERAVAGRNASACYAINGTTYQDSCILSIANKYRQRLLLQLHNRQLHSAARMQGICRCSCEQRYQMNNDGVPMEDAGNCIVSSIRMAHNPIDNIYTAYLGHINGAQERDTARAVRQGKCAWGERGSPEPRRQKERG